jgi:A/G-specific adenine glycosylase
LNIPSFRKALLRWFEAGHRDLPWRRTRDPYAIWLSEIMLQQTRAAAAIPYYHQFLERFPTVEALARAPESEVLAAWSGLGYYHRARNLQKAALMMDQAGAFPADHDAIRALPGVGDYTAAAVASIAFGLPHAVLDGNVMRVIARVTADGGDIGAGVTRRRFQEAADGWLDTGKPGAFNQALMELGATICLPRNPQCLVCPVAAFCEAFAAQAQAQYPVKGARVKAAIAVSELVVVERAGAFLVRQRPVDSKRMAGFWELPDDAQFPAAWPRGKLGTFSHTIVNTRWSVTVYRLRTRGSVRLPEGVQWIARTELTALPLTTITKKALALNGRNH